MNANGLAPGDTFPFVFLDDMTDAQYEQSQIPEAVTPESGQRHLVFRYPTVAEQRAIESQFVDAEAAFRKKVGGIELQPKSPNELVASLQAVEQAQSDSYADYAGAVGRLFVRSVGFAESDSLADILRPDQLVEVRARLFRESQFQITEKKRLRSLSRSRIASSAEPANVASVPNVEPGQSSASPATEPSKNPPVDAAEGKGQST